MPRWLVNGGKCIALPSFFYLLTAIAVITPELVQAETFSRPPVYRQQYDDDCGVAALRMLLQRAGIDAQDKELLAGLKPTSGEDALTAADLSDMVKALNLGLSLEVGFLPLDAVSRLADREPFLILMTPRSIGGGNAVDHFILIEGRALGAFVVADPILPKRTLLKDELFRSDAYGKMIEGRPHAIVLRLTKDGSAASRPLPSEAEDGNLREWDQAYRLPQTLPPGKWVISASHIRQNDKLSDTEEDIEITGASDVSVLSVSRGLGNRSQINLNLARISGTGVFRLPGETFSFDRSGDFHAETRIDHIPDVALPPSFELSTSAALEWDNGIAPSAAAAGAAIEWAGGRLAAGLAADVRFDGRLVAVATPSISYRLPTKSGFTIEAAASSPFRIGDRRLQMDLQLAVSRQLGMDFRISAFLNKGIIQERGTAHSQFGITLTYGVPRRFRRAQITPAMLIRPQNISN